MSSCEASNSLHARPQSCFPKITMISDLSAELNRESYGKGPGCFTVPAPPSECGRMGLQLDDNSWITTILSYTFFQKRWIFPPLLFYLFIFFVFLGSHQQHMKAPRFRVELELSIVAGLHHSHSKARSKPYLRPTPQLKAMQGNAGFLAHWARPGIEHASSWMLVRFILTDPGWDPPWGHIPFFFFF